MITPLTHAEYVAHIGTRCPLCHGDGCVTCTDQSTFSVALDEDENPVILTQSLCESCGATWQDVHALVGYVRQRPRPELRLHRD